MSRPECPAENTAAIEQTSFFNENGINWTPHTIGWSIAGGCAVLVCLPSADQYSISWPTLADTALVSDTAHHRRERLQALQVCRDRDRGSS